MWNFKSLQKPLVFLFLLCLFPLGALAQSTVSGTVNDESGEPIIGASVKVQGTQTGAITDFNGNFNVQAGANATLQISYIGYVSASVKVNGRSNITVTLKEDAQTLNDVVVIGYGVQKKSDLTGAVASVKGDDIKNLSTSDAGAALQGKVTGVQIINSGSPGGGAEIRVRGYSSNSGNTGPLLIVDGLKVDNIQYLDPTLIESIEVLKDGASAAIYGAQAGNGVVLITTRNGSKGKAHVTYSLKASLQSLGKKSELFHANDYIDYHKYLGDLTDAELEQKAYKTGFVDTDWYDEVFENTMSYQHNLTVEGGNDRGHFLVGLGLVDNNGIVKGNKDTYKRFTGQLNADYKFFDWLSIQSNTSVEKWNRRYLANGYGSFLNAVVSIDPLTPAYIYDESDFGMNVESAWNSENHGFVLLPPNYTEENPVWYGTSKYVEDATANPLGQRDRSLGTNEGVNVRGSLAANLTPISGLTITSRLGYRITQSNGHNYGEPYFLSSLAKSETYSISANTNAGLYYQWENFANFNKQFGKHNVGAMAGMSYTKNHWDNTSVSASDSKMILRGDHAPNFRYIDCLNDNGKEHLTVGNTPGDATELAYFGRLSYSFDDRYFLQANFRADAFDSSKLSDENRWGYFPSFSAGWTISNEPFFKNAVSTSAVSFLKLRASWGRNGNVNVLSGYRYNASIGLGGYYHFYDMSTVGGPSEGGKPNGVSNPDLTWETSEQVDFGIDARFLDNRLSFGLDWYRKMTKDLLITIQPYPELGFESQTVNSGEILNTGVDLEVGWRDHIGDFKYSVSANFSPLKNEVQKVNSMLPRFSQGGISGFNNKLKSTFESGHTIWYFRGFEYLGVYDENTCKLVGDEQAKPEEMGKPIYSGQNGPTLAPVDEDMTDLGSGIPKFTYGVTLNFEYKGFDLTVFGTGASGNKIYNLMVSADRPRVNGLDVWWKDSWRQDESGNYTIRGQYPDAKYISTDWIFFSSSANIFSGSFFKFKQIQLGYTIPSQYTKKLMISNLRLSVSLDDYFTITSYPGADPETASFDSGASRGWDNGNYPTSKKVVFGLNVTF